MPTFVSDLEPGAVWRHFDQILATPRPSKRESALRAAIEKWADSRGLVHRADAAGNLVVELPASSGRASASPIVLQSHLDMVCEKNADIAFDFDRDAIVPRREGDWLYATGTTLGSDNGIGVAAMLAVGDQRDLVHGPLELLFTVEEEIGLNGAAEVTPELVRGRTLLNLDTEEEYSLYVGCSGGAGCELAVPLDAMFGAEGRVALVVGVGGLKGGHSGVDIHLQRGNAIVVLARALHALWRQFAFEVISISGGNLTNAIPREAEALVRVAASDRDAFERAFALAVEEQRLELVQVDAGLFATVGLAKAEGGAAAGEVWSDETTRRTLAFLVALPHGVARMSDSIPGLVESSTNLARVRTEGTVLQVAISNRSSSATALAALQQRTSAAAELVNAVATVNEGYPGWQPNLDSPLLATMRAVHERVLGRAPAVKAIHAGLECGILGAKLPGSDMISFGPQIEHPHSPDERVSIPSVERFWKLLTAALTELAD
jgi:dipeptidase D